MYSPDAAPVDAYYDITVRVRVRARVRVRVRVRGGITFYDFTPHFL